MYSWHWDFEIENLSGRCWNFLSNFVSKHIYLLCSLTYMVFNLELIVKNDDNNYNIWLLWMILPSMMHDDSRGVNVGTEEATKKPKSKWLLPQKMRLKHIIQNMLKLKGLVCPKEVLDLIRAKNWGTWFSLCVRQCTTKLIVFNILRPRPIETFKCKVIINETLYLDRRYTLSIVVLELTHALSQGKSEIFLDPIGRWIQPPKNNWIQEIALV